MVASSKLDAIIVGAGHNGLVTAGCLAKAVLVELDALGEEERV